MKLEFPYGSFKGIGTEKPLCSGLDEYYQKFKGKAKVVGLFNFVKPVLLVIDPDVIKHVMIQNFDTFHDRYLYYNQVCNNNNNMKKDPKINLIFTIIQRDDPISVHLLALQGKIIKFGNKIYLFKKKKNKS